jgi:hypothetical protein
VAAAKHHLKENIVETNAHANPMALHALPNAKDAEDVFV